MHATSLAALTLTALALGFATGRVFERAVRAWADLTAAKAQVPILRAAARLLSAKAVGGSSSRRQWRCGRCTP